MKRGKRFLEKDSFIIYGGVAIFSILAISIGIILYMTSHNTKKEKVGIVTDEPKIEENIESASSNVGKNVTDQEKSLIKENTEVQNTIAEPKTETKKETKTNTNINTNTEKKNEPAKVIETKKEVNFIKPVEGEIIGEYAKDNLIFSETLKEWITHTAIDIKADKTSIVKSSADGIVKSIVNDPRYGLTVVVEHDDGYQTVYSNLLTAEFVVEGEEITQGQSIGTIGSTAAFEIGMESHLHFEILKNGEYVDPNIYIG